MFDDRLIRERYQPGELQALHDAFKIIHTLGVIPLHVHANSSRIAEGFTERNPEELVKEIMQVQQTNRNLLALHEWAGNFQGNHGNES